VSGSSEGWVTEGGSGAEGERGRGWMGGRSGLLWDWGAVERSVKGYSRVGSIRYREGGGEGTESGGGCGWGCRRAGEGGRETWVW